MNNFGIYTATTGGMRVYFFLTDKYMSDDFDSIEQLIDVGLDDPGKIVIQTAYNNRTHLEKCLLNEPDVEYLFSIDNLDDINERYPEWLL